MLARGARDEGAAGGERARGEEVFVRHGRARGRAESRTDPRRLVGDDHRGAVGGALGAELVEVPAMLDATSVSAPIGETWRIDGRP